MLRLLVGSQRSRCGLSSLRAEPLNRAACFLSHFVPPCSRTFASAASAATAAAAAAPVLASPSASSTSSSPSSRTSRATSSSSSSTAITVVPVPYPGTTSVTPNEPFAVQTTGGYKLDDALRVVKAYANAAFDEGIVMAVNLNLDVRKPNQVCRGMANIPYTFRNTKVAVFATGDKVRRGLSCSPLLVIWPSSCPLVLSSPPLSSLMYCTLFLFLLYIRSNFSSPPFFFVTDRRPRLGRPEPRS